MFEYPPCIAKQWFGIITCRIKQKPVQYRLKFHLKTLIVVFCSHLVSALPFLSNFISPQAKYKKSFLLPQSLPINRPFFRGLLSSFRSPNVKQLYSNKVTNDLLGMSKQDIRQLTGTIKGHCQSNNYLHTMGKPSIHIL